MQVGPKEPSNAGSLVAQVVSAVLDDADPEPLPPNCAPSLIPGGLTPREQLFAYVMAYGAPSIKAIGTLVMRTAVAVLLLVIAGLLAWGGVVGTR